MTENNQIKYTVVVCTYNPDLRVLTRCLKAIKKIFDKSSAELIIVDNNSSQPISEIDTVKKQLAVFSNRKLIHEARPGLTFARMAGVKAASGNIIVFFDDDNEPCSDYLIQLKQLHINHPHVAAWGPGIVSVDFIDGVDASLESFLRPMFQEKQHKHLEYAMLRSWQNCYPFGTGLCIKKSVFDEYIVEVSNNKFTLTDRKGTSLSSGGDTQMVLFCIALGFAAGTSPNLKVNHVISEKKLQFNYLKKLVHGTSFCYHQCHTEVFPEYKSSIIDDKINFKKIERQIIKKFIKLKINSNTIKTLHLVSELSNLLGRYHLEEKPIPKSITWVFKNLMEPK